MNQTSTDRVTVALNMIVKDCAEGMERAILSVSDVGFDEIVIVDTGSTDKTPEVAARYADVFRSYTNYDPVEFGGKNYLSDFAGARDYARILSTSDYVFFLDSDDVVDKPDILKKFIDEMIRTRKYDGFFMAYDYEHDNYGNCVCRHQVLRCAERMCHAWRSPIHEVMCAVFRPNKTTLPPDCCKVIHLGKRQDSITRCGRNAAVAEYWIKNLPENEIEPRLWLNYGKSLVTLGRFEEAIEALHKYLDGSQWNEERYFAYLCCGSARSDQGQIEKAISEYLSAIRLLPTVKEAYIDLSACYIKLNDYKAALHWLDVADMLDVELVYTRNPYQQETRTLRNRAMAYFNMERFDDCIRACNEVLTRNPTDRDVMEMKITASNLLRHTDLIESYKKVEFIVSREGDPQKMRDFLNCLPRCLENEPEFLSKVEVDSSKTRIAILCGECPEPWGPKSHIEGGIGGSETAVIHMAKELTALGYSVEVYGYPEAGEEGIHDGVLWLPYWRFSKAPEPDVLIAWRQPSWITWSPQARARYIWLHDVQVQNNWHPELYDWLNGAFFLSKYHRSTAPWVSDEKVILSSNGVDPSFFKEGSNDPRRCLFASGPDRGLDYLLSVWSNIREAHPEATLDLCYGFSPLFRKSMETSERYRKIYADVMRLKDQPGVKWHGRVSQEKLAQITADCGVWLYPTSFPEISCITAMQAQVNGAVPITTGYAALSETVRHGVVVGGPSETIESDPKLGDRWLEQAIKTIGNEKKQNAIRKEMIPWARKNFLWTSVATQWHQIFQRDLKGSSSRIALSTEKSTTTLPSRLSQISKPKIRLNA